MENTRVGDWVTIIEEQINDDGSVHSIREKRVWIAAESIYRDGRLVGLDSPSNVGNSSL